MINMIPLLRELLLKMTWVATMMRACSHSAEPGKSLKIYAQFKNWP